MTDPREPPAAGAPPKSSDVVVEGVEDPRFPLLAAEWPEYGLRIDPSSGRTPPSAPPEQPPPAVVQAPARAPDASARRRAARAVTFGAILPMLVVAAIGGTLLYRSTTGGASSPHRMRHTSAPPPAFTVSTTVTAHAAAPSGIAVAGAGNGGLWYQAAGGALTRLASTDGHVSYRFSTGSPALGLAVSGDSLLTVTNTPAGGALVAHARGSGAVTSRAPLPGTPVCGFAAAAGCDPAVANGAAWVALDEGVARVEAGRATLIPVPGVRAVTSGGRRIWAITATELYRLDPSGGRVLGRSSLRGLAPVAMAAGAGAVWVAGTRDGRSVVLRFDGPAGRKPLTISMPSAVRAIVATEHAVWAALEGGGVRELDPSRNRLAGTAVGLPDADALLVARPGQLWAVRLRDGRAAFTRIDLTPTR
ncbi:MAG TPA: hypothetical protein VGC71_00085 [Gaiellales bacterium]